jgi:hypothetical protein
VHGRQVGFEVHVLQALHVSAHVGQGRAEDRLHGHRNVQMKRYDRKQDTVTVTPLLLRKQREERRVTSED